MNFINKNMLSVGYNPDNGQQFFDLLNEYKQWIHSFFFSVSYDMRGSSLDRSKILSQFKSLNTYDIPGNLLFNSREDLIYSDSLYKIFDNLDLIYELIDLINLKAITVVDLKMAKIIKHKFPDLEIHLSVRYFDWNLELSCIDLLKRDIEYIKRFIDVINISGYRSYNDSTLFNFIKQLNIKTKFIVNEGCVINKEENFQKFPEFKYCKCYYDNKNGCERSCIDIIYRELPWLELSAINFYKEQLKFIQYDILKLSERINTVSDVKTDLEYWCNPNRTTKLFTKNTDIEISYNKIPYYMEWLHKRSTSCIGNCYNCRACEKYYNILKGE